MKRLQHLIPLIFAILLVSSAEMSAAMTEEQYRDRRRLSEVDEKYHNAAKTVAAVLVANKEDPIEFRASIEERADGKVFVFHLWHLTAFKLEREAKKKGYSIIGNPGGRCCDVIYDVKYGKASNPGLWQ